MTRHLSIISLLTEPRIFSVSLTLQQGIRLPKASHPRPPTACHPRVLIGTYQIWTSSANSLYNNHLCDLMSQLTLLTGAEPWQIVKSWYSFKRPVEQIDGLRRRLLRSFTRRSSPACARRRFMRGRRRNPEFQSLPEESAYVRV